MCPDILGAEFGFDFVSAASSGVDFEKAYRLSDALKVQCPAGYMLDLRSEREAGFVLEGVGNIKVLGSSSFAAPLSNIDSEYEVKGLPGFGIRLPAGAWPAGDTRPLKLTVLEVNSNPVLAKELEKMGGAKLMGKGIYFEPSGIVFGKPVEIAIPYDNSIDLGNLELNVHRHDATKGFQKISLSSQRVSPIDSFSKTIFAETLSFSMYAPLATPLSAVAEEAETATVENITVTEPEEPTKGLPMGVIVAATVGSVGFVLLVMAIYCWCCRNRRENTQKKASITKEEARPAQRGITPYEARATRDLPSSPEVPKNAQKQRGDLERAMPVDPPPPSEPAPPTTYSTRYAPEVPPPEEEAPVLHMESPRYGDSATPPMTPNAPILSSEYSMQEKSPLDSFSVSDIASLLPPGWLCCVKCKQPVNSSWHKCPKCGAPPDPSYNAV